MSHMIWVIGYESLDMTHIIWVIVWKSKIDHRLNYSNQFRLQLLELYLLMSFQFAQISIYPRLFSWISDPHFLSRDVRTRPGISTGSDRNSKPNIFGPVRSIDFWPDRKSGPGTDPRSGRPCLQRVIRGKSPVHFLSYSHENPIFT